MEWGGRPTPRWPEWLRLHWAAGLGAQRPEVAPTIRTEGDRLAVDELSTVRRATASADEPHRAR